MEYVDSVQMTSYDFSKKVKTDMEMNAVQTYNYTGAVPYTSYLLIAVDEVEAQNIFAQDNFYYIDQQIADESGSVTFNYTTPDNCTYIFIGDFGKGEYCRIVSDTISTDIEKCTICGENVDDTGKEDTPSTGTTPVEPIFTTTVQTTSTSSETTDINSTKATTATTKAATTTTKATTTTAKATTTTTKATTTTTDATTTTTKATTTTTKATTVTTKATTTKATTTTTKETTTTTIPETTTTEATEPILPISGTCGEKLTWLLDDEGTLTISGIGEMDNWGQNGTHSPWYGHRSDIVNIIIENGVTSIGDNAFAFCISLTSVTVPESVASIGKRAFYCCSYLISITIENPKCVIWDDESTICNGDREKLDNVNDAIEKLDKAKDDLDTAQVNLDTAYAEIDRIKEELGVLEGNNGTSEEIAVKRVELADAEANLDDAMAALDLAKAALDEAQANYEYYYDEWLRYCEDMDSNDQNNCEFNGVIYGYKNSTVQTYAEKYSREFTAHNEETTTTETETTTTLQTTTTTNTTTSSTTTTTTTTTTSETTSTTTPSETTTTELELGDVNGDGKIDASDAAEILVEAALIGAGNGGEFSDEQNAAADVNGDGKVDASDAAVILVYAAMVGAGNNVKIEDCV